MLTISRDEDRFTLVDVDILAPHVALATFSMSDEEKRAFGGCMLCLEGECEESALARMDWGPAPRDTSLETRRALLEQTRAHLPALRAEREAEVARLVAAGAAKRRHGEEGGAAALHRARAALAALDAARLDASIAECDALQSKYLDEDVWRRPLRAAVRARRVGAYALLYDAPARRTVCGAPLADAARAHVAHTECLARHVLAGRAECAACRRVPGDAQCGARAVAVVCGMPVRGAVSAVAWRPAARRTAVVLRVDRIGALRVEPPFDLALARTDVILIGADADADADASEHDALALAPCSEDLYDTLVHGFCEISTGDYCELAYVVATLLGVGETAVGGAGYRVVPLQINGAPVAWTRGLTDLREETLRSAVAKNACVVSSARMRPLARDDARAASRLVCAGVFALNVASVPTQLALAASRTVARQLESDDDAAAAAQSDTAWSIAPVDSAGRVGTPLALHAHTRTFFGSMLLGGTLRANPDASALPVAILLRSADGATSLLYYGGAGGVTTRYKSNYGDVAVVDPLLGVVWVRAHGDALRAAAHTRAAFAPRLHLGALTANAWRLKRHDRAHEHGRVSLAAPLYTERATGSCISFRSGLESEFSADGPPTMLDAMLRALQRHTGRFSLQTREPGAEAWRVVALFNLADAVRHRGVCSVRSCEGAQLRAEWCRERAWLEVAPHFALEPHKGAAKNE
jgi:hypothetical protein